MAPASIRRHNRQGDDSRSTYYFSKKNTIYASTKKAGEDESLYYSK